MKAVKKAAKKATKKKVVKKKTMKKRAGENCLTYLQKNGGVRMVAFGISGTMPCGVSLEDP